MHIPENYLSPSTCAVMGAAMVPVWVHAVKKVKEEVPKEKMPLLGVGAAFSFVGMMFNIPIPGGTTGHAVGGTLIAILLGPDAACIAVSIALLIQALLFGDGGILSFGANCFNMAFVLPYVGYGIYTLLRSRMKSDRGKYFAAAAGAYVGINAAAFCAAVEFGIQPLLFHDAAGQALYCPYGFSVSIPSMMIGHLTLFGIAEIIFTTAIYAFVSRTAPGLLRENSLKDGAGLSSKRQKKSMKPLFGLLAVLVLLVPLGLLAQGTAWGEWGSDEISQIVTNGKALGYTPKGLSDGFSLNAILPDYSVPGLPDAVGYILSAVIGIAILVIAFRLIAAMMKTKTDFSV